MNTNPKVYPPPPKLSGIAAKVLSAYVEWNKEIRHIPKISRYSIGIKIDILFADIIELVAAAQFEIKEKRVFTIASAITKNDTLKFMLFVLLELGALEKNKFFSLSLKMEEVGRMLYGWKNQALAQLKK